MYPPRAATTKSVRPNPNSRPARSFTTLTTDVQYDTRNDRRDPAAGWLVDAGVELELKGSERFRYGSVDVRRYARLSPNAKIGIRGVVAGSINGE